MTNSDQPRLNRSALCGHIRELKTLWSAWLSIRPKALHSRDQQTRTDARCIDENPYGALLALQRQLRSGKFQFEPQRGVLKTRRGKSPRPLVISPVTNRIVQRAILDTLQSNRPFVIRRLGSIPNVLHTHTSVGGIPGKGSSDAVAIIRDAIEADATYFVRSDIKDFFTRIKTKELISEIERITDDAEFANIVADGLRVELKNADQPWVREWIELFPDGDVGVPQGSSLSTFCANFVLREFDYALNCNGLVMVRYIDDFVILGHSRNAVTRGWADAKSILRNLDLEVHEPEPNGEKASSGQVSRGFEFLSYRFCGKCVGLSSLAKSTILTKSMRISQLQRS